MTIWEKLSAIQEELKVPKDQRNDFGGFNYRSCEDILEKVKPICKQHGTVLMLWDELLNIGDRYYVKATALLQDLESVDVVTSYAYAREEESKKGMDGSQVTGASSSYARKYALNGLFCIDDVKDSDFTNRGDKPAQKPQNTERRENTPAKPQNAPQRKPEQEYEAEYVCDSCGKKISQKVNDYSIKKFGIPLCMDCQKDYAR